MNDISSLGFHWRYIFPRFQTVSYFPALAPQYGSDCCHALLKFFTGIVILFTVTRFQRRSKVTRWDIRQDCSFLFSFETSQVQTGTLGLSCWGCDSLCYSLLHFFVDLQMALQKKGMDCGFVNTISKLPSHHVKGASVLLVIQLVQKLSQLKSLTVFIKTFSTYTRPQRL